MVHSHSSLTSLQFGPQIVQGDFHVQSAQLRAIDYIAKYIKGELDLNNNQNIHVTGFPQYVVAGINAH